jgi:hypothetical protein
MEQGCLLWYSCFQLPWSSMEALDGIGPQHWIMDRKEDPGFNEDETEEGLSSVFATCFSSVNDNPKSLLLL